MKTYLHTTEAKCLRYFSFKKVGDEQVEKMVDQIVVKLDEGCLSHLHDGDKIRVILGKPMYTDEIFGIDLVRLGIYS